MAALTCVDATMLETSGGVQKHNLISAAAAAAATSATSSSAVNNQRHMGQAEIAGINMSFGEETKDLPKIPTTTTITTTTMTTISSKEALTRPSESRDLEEDCVR